MTSARLSLPLVAALAACGGDPAPMPDAAQLDVVVRDESAADVPAELDVATLDAPDGQAADAAARADVPPAARDVVCAEGSVPSGTGCVCADGFRLCAGACLDVRADPHNCGACGNDCAAMDCVDAVCACAAGHTLCGRACVDLMRDPMNCGRCGTTCPTLPNSAPACTEGQCAEACFPGFADCNVRVTDGCETDITTSAANCGRCGHACARGQTCAAGVCG